jgi:single-strand DNA-binding protein
MNYVILIGRLTNDVEVKEVGENKVVNFTLAVQRTYKNKDGENEADFINCSVWGTTAENLKNYCSKGSQVAVKGQLVTSSYEDKDGNKRYKTEVRVDHITYLQPKKEEVK